MEPCLSPPFRRIAIIGQPCRSVLDEIFRLLRTAAHARANPIEPPRNSLCDLRKVFGPPALIGHHLSIKLLTPRLLRAGCI